MQDVRARFGAALRAWRHRRHLTQEQLAERSGLSYKFIGEVERGTGNPTLETLARLANALGISMSGLLADAESKSTAISDYRISQRQIQVVRQAADSLEALVEHLSDPSYESRRRRKRPR
ncbi:MAG: helix-turn-helix domain-containing protein [Vicinamibacterales bacterium]